MTRDDRQALDIARGLAAAGVPVFVAYPDPGKPGKYIPRGKWQTFAANPSYVDAWKPGLALCAVMGQGIDLVDIDPRNGGNPAVLDGLLPPVLGTAATPSGGEHRFVQSMGVRSRDGVLPGIDVKAGDGGGNGRGFAFIAPTVGISKTTGERVTYRWITPPDPGRVNGERAGGARLAELVRQAHGSHRTLPAGQGFSQPGIRKHAGPVPYGEHHARLVGYAGWLRSMGVPLQPEAEALMLRRLQDCEQPPGAARPRYTEAEALAELHDVYGRYPAGDPAAETAAAGSGGGPGLPDFDLGALAARGIKEPERIAGGMLYRGGIHCLAGVPGGGKTTLMAWWMLQHIREGGHVMFLDEESGPELAAEKFLDLGAEPGELSPPRFTYIPFPARGWNATDLAQLHERIELRRPGIVGWDSTAAFLAIAGRDENSATDVTAFWQKVLIPCGRQFGAAVVGIDHTPKNGDPGGYGRGSGAKKAASDVQYMLETVKAFNRAQDGILRLTTMPGKDRRGWLATAYEIHVRHGPPVALNITEAAPGVKQDEDDWQPAKRKLWEALRAVASEREPAEASRLVDWINDEHGHGLKRQTCSTLLNQLAADGFADCIDTGPGRPKLWFPLTRPPVSDASAATRLSASAPLKGLTTGHADTPLPADGLGSLWLPDSLGAAANE